MANNNDRSGGYGSTSAAFVTESRWQCVNVTPETSATKTTKTNCFEYFMIASWRLRWDAV